MHAQIDYNCESGTGRGYRDGVRHTMAFTLYPGLPTDGNELCFYVVGGENLDLLFLAVQTEMPDLLELGICSQTQVANLEDHAFTLFNAIGGNVSYAAKNLGYLWNSADEDYGPLQVRNLCVVVSIDS